MSILFCTFAPDLTISSMYRNLHTIFGMLLLVLCPAVTRAERIPTSHNFQTMNKSTELIITDSYTKAKTDLLRYTCSGTYAKFDRYGGSIWSISLPKSNRFVTTTRVNELDGFDFVYYPASSNESIKVYVSKDSISWGKALSGDSIEYSAGSVAVTIPRNNYYVRIKNESSTDIFIPAIIWYQDHCNCFIYEP